MYVEGISSSNLTSYSKKRKKHDAITDCELLSKVYINLIGQKEPTLKLNSDIQFDKIEELSKNKTYYKKIIYQSKDELNLHNNFLKDSLGSIRDSNIGKNTHKKTIFA